MKTHDIYNTALVPYIIAERAIWNVMENDEKYKTYSPEQMSQVVENFTQPLCDKAEICYKYNDLWRKQLNKSMDERGFLQGFMEHWAKGLLKTKK